MPTYAFSTLQWNSEAVVFPVTGETVRTHYLYLVPVEVDAPETQYLLIHVRTKKILCTLVVTASEKAEFKRFENTLLASKLEAGRGRR